VSAVHWPSVVQGVQAWLTHEARLTIENVPGETALRLALAQ